MSSDEHALSYQSEKQEEPCEDCQGSGSVLIGGDEPHTQGWVACPECYGTGFKESAEDQAYREIGEALGYGSPSETSSKGDE